MFIITVRIYICVHELNKIHTHVRLTLKRKSQIAYSAVSVLYYQHLLQTSENYCEAL